ncbi:MAG: hypothetical protein H7Z17_19840 [Fuerstia sp.]|nr:hypothetical protein [Fuerstiella sp.]
MSYHVEPENILGILVLRDRRAFRLDEFDDYPLQRLSRYGCHQLQPVQHVHVQLP